MAIPVTEKKLREAEFFFEQMRRRALDGANLASEQFEFYFSAFVTAARSVTMVLQKEDTAGYETWFVPWRDAVAGRAELLGFMNEERVAVVHRLGASHVAEVEFINAFEYQVRAPREEGRGRRRRGGLVTVVQPYTYDAQAQVGVQRFYFQYLGQRREVVELSGEYLSVLQQLVRDFVTWRSAQP
jgi:hypothetical protein